jgi:glycosyltransferase involved in cell wall biosynthesis
VPLKFLYSGVDAVPIQAFTMRSTAPRPDISVVILCYRTEEFVPAFVKQMKRALEDRHLSYELVLVANYHADATVPDRTPEIARALAREDPCIRVVAKPKQGMMGWDMRSGLEVAGGATVAVIDGDGQMPPADVIAVYDRLRAHGFDMAQTYREERHDGLVRILISRIYNVVLKALFPSVRVRDANGKPKIFTRKGLEKLTLTSDDWFVDAEIIIQATRLGFRIGEVPTVFYTNPQRPSFIGVKAIVEFLVNLLTYRVRTLWG